MDKYKILKQYFGFDSFRPGQEEIIDAILSGRDAFGIMPTGGGKSICYQIPALMISGVALVISPLISLMKDQVMQLKELGVPAAFINSTLTPAQQNLAYDRMRRGEYKIVYVAPERLETDEFAHVARMLDISVFAIDEAHCISQWGHDFRKSYLRIADFVAALPKRPVVAAFTATATERVRLDIKELLRLEDPEKVITSFDRSNLAYSVLKPKNRMKALASLIGERSRQNGIVYCATRSGVERICERLCAEGISATRYHAGLADSEKSANQEDFQYDRRSVMVATNAFGMGINKSNVNYIIHYNMPKSLEEYYQEAGRAGRDGENAECILLYSKGDAFTAKALIAGEGVMPPSENELWERFPKEMEKLSAMTDYCETMDCYRGKILDYFGEVHPDFCGNCGNCKDEFEVLDITASAQMILSCISRIKTKLGFCVGKTVVKEVLIGKNTVRVAKYKLSDIKTFGIMKDKTRDETEYLIDILISEGLILVNEEYKTIDLTEKSRSVLFEGAAVFGKFRKKSAEALSDGRREKKKKKTEKAAGGGTEDFAESKELYEKLRRLRYELATRERIPAYAVLSNAALSDMVEKMPTTMDEFLEVFGVGEAKARKYGEAFLKVITEHYISEMKFNEIPPEQTPREFELKIKDTPIADTACDDAFVEMLRMASEIITKQYKDGYCGVPLKVTVILTAKGTLRSAFNGKGDFVSLCAEEKELLKALKKENDTKILKMLSMTRDGALISPSVLLIKEFTRMNAENRNAEVLFTISPQYSYIGYYEPSKYRKQKAESFILL